MAAVLNDLSEAIQNLPEAIRQKAVSKQSSESARFPIEKDRDRGGIFDDLAHEESLPVR